MTWGAWENVGTTIVDSSGWSLKDIALTAYAGNKVRIGFYHTAQCYYGDCRDTSTGWYIDDILLSIESCKVWTSDYAGNSKDEFKPGDQIRYNFDFSFKNLFGDPKKQYKINAKGNVKATSGIAWGYLLSEVLKSKLLSPIKYHKHWDKNVSKHAQLKSRARYLGKLTLKDGSGKLNKWVKIYRFKVK